MRGNRGRIIQGCAVSRGASALQIFDPLGKSDRDRLHSEIYVRADIGGEWDVEPASRSVDDQQHAAACFFDLDHFSARSPLAIDQREPDEVVEKVFVLIQ